MSNTLRSWLIALPWAVLAIVLAMRFMPGELPPRLPAVTLTTIEDRQLDAAALRGHPVLVTFWSITCGPCLHEIPDLIDLHRELAPKGLVILAVAMPYDRPDLVLALARERQLPYDIVLDPMGKTGTAFGEIDATPTTFLFDAEGRGVKRLVGSMNAGRMRKAILALLPAAPQHADHAALTPAGLPHALD
jgi:thiol-disulfide isomerase/thioredoxin